MSYHVSCSEGYVVGQHNSPLMLYLILEVHGVGCVDILIFIVFQNFPKLPLLGLVHFLHS